MTAIPVITVFVRHDPDCQYRGDPFYKRCACWKHLRWFQDGKQVRRATKQKTWAGAERARHQVEAEFLAPSDPQTERISVRKVIEVFLQKKKGEGIAGVTLGRYECEMERLTMFCDVRNRHTLAHVTAQDLLDYRDTWDEFTPANATKSKVRERLKSLFRFAKKVKYIDQDPLEGKGRECLITPIASDSAPTLPLTAAEYEKLLAAVEIVFQDRPPAINDPWYARKRQRVHAFVQCMRYTGLAIGDVVALPKDRIVHLPDKNITRVILHRIKTEKQRGTRSDILVPIPEHIAHELMQVPNDNPRYVFWNSGTGSLLTAVTRWSKTVSELFHAAGFPEGHSHQLRDTFAVELLQAGVPIGEVSKLLGHSSIKTTEKHYSPWVVGRQDRLDDLVTKTFQKSTEPAPIRRVK